MKFEMAMYFQLSNNINRFPNSLELLYDRLAIIKHLFVIYDMGAIPTLPAIVHIPFLKQSYTLIDNSYVSMESRVSLCQTN